MGDEDRVTRGNGDSIIIGDTSASITFVNSTKRVYLITLLYRSPSQALKRMHNQVERQDGHALSLE